MSHIGSALFDSSIHLTNAWLKELTAEMGWLEDRGRAYHALRVVLHALRDRLPLGEVADLAAQLPLIIRGIYYEGWRPAAAPVKYHTKEQFLKHVVEDFPDALPGEVEAAVRAVFKVLSRRIGRGEIEDIRNSIPTRMRQLWD